MFAAKMAFQSPQPLVANARRTGGSSTNASQTWTASGAVTSTSQFKFGTASEYVSTSSQYIQTSSPTPTFMNYGTGDFTIEWWIYIPSTGVSSGHSPSSDLLSQDLAGGFGVRLAQRYDTNGLNTSSPQYINIFARAQADLSYWTLPTNWPTSQWVFCALQRKGTTLSFWLNGTLCTRSDGPDGSGATRNFASAGGGSTVKIGTADGANGVGPAYIDEICFSNTYRYDDTTIDIPVPTAAFNLDSYTTQLLHMDGSNGGTTFTNVTS
jgi:hypothetical protein